MADPQNTSPSPADAWVQDALASTAPTAAASSSSNEADDWVNDALGTPKPQGPSIWQRVKNATVGHGTLLGQFGNEMSDWGPNSEDARINELWKTINQGSPDDAAAASAQLE